LRNPSFTATIDWTFMRDIEIPFQPVRSSLYSPGELLSGFDALDPNSLAKTLDFRTFYYYVSQGRSNSSNSVASMMEALHDSFMLQAMLDLLNRAGKPVAAIMGGHSEVRGTTAYRQVSRLAQRLTKAGFLVASGGGPGVMEASHLGALLCNEGPDALESAWSTLERSAPLPLAQQVINSSTLVVDESIVRGLHQWVLPALELARSYPEGGQSLALPTWHYGHEPFSPLATHVAKFFQNSLREDALLALATHGVVYAQGKAGTLQEVFQDAAQNFYHSDKGRFSPMVFLGRAYWTEKLPVKPLLEALFRLGNETVQNEARERVLFTDCEDEAVEFLTRADNLGHQHLQARLSDLGWCNQGSMA
jgi:predicted Rossmann-fold nucleotide-binding protein